MCSYLDACKATVQHALCIWAQQLRVHPTFRPTEMEPTYGPVQVLPGQLGCTIMQYLSHGPTTLDNKHKCTYVVRTFVFPPVPCPAVS